MWMWELFSFGLQKISDSPFASYNACPSELVSLLQHVRINGSMELNIELHGKKKKESSKIGLNEDARDKKRLDRGREGVSSWVESQ